MIGETIGGRYAISRLLGQGGMGAVYEGRHTGTDRRVAVKVITAGLEVRPAILARFEVEARAAGKIESRHIAQVFDVGKDESKGGLPYLVMEYLVGEDVQQLIRRVGPLAPSLAVRIVAQACLGLEKAHAGGIVHRDIKPANLFVCQQEDDTCIVKVLDFGVAKIRPDGALPDSGALTSTGALLGSPLYMSPEQARGSKSIDARSDVWSLGVVLYQALTGRTPFQHIEAMGELIIALCSTPAQPVDQFAPWVDPRLARVVGKALEIPVESRFQTARELFLALKELTKGTTIEASMLVGVSDDERSGVLPLAGPTPPPGSESGDVSFGGAAAARAATSGERLSPGSTQTTTAVTAGGAEKAAPAGKKPVVAIAAVAAVALAAGLFVVLRGTGHDTAAAHEPTPAATPVETAAPAAPATATPT
ncbi:MAG TPA: serine/threonine-protein kinase, partial [Minicystis sp.]|nr:serine/threonine-protein kinase [Minicystis sp.]